ncbi:MAG: type II secretion system protein [Thermodesulfobacteriota bacterium]
MKPGRIPYSGRGGFTMIEVTVVLLIMAFLVLLAMARSSYNANELINQTELLKARLRYAQYMSLSGNDTSRWGLSFNTGTSANAYTFFRAYNGGVQNLLFPGDTAAGYSFPSGSRIVVSSVTNPGGLTGAYSAPSPPYLAYNDLGYISNAASTITLMDNNTGQTETVTVVANTGFVQ